jgi:hypothetical protein
MAFREKIAQEIETMLGCEEAAAVVRGFPID